MAIHIEPKAKVKLKGKAEKVAAHQRSQARLLRAVESHQAVAKPTFEQGHFNLSRQELDDMSIASSRFLESLSGDQLGNFVEA